MKKLLKQGVKILPILIMFFVAGCSKSNSAGGGATPPPPPPTPVAPTLTVLPSTVFNVNYGSPATFTWTTNGMSVYLNGVLNTAGSYTTPPLTGNTNDTLVAYGNAAHDASLTTTVIVRMAVAVPDQNILFLTNLPWIVTEKKFRFLDSLGNPISGWFFMTNLGCDTTKYNLNTTDPTLPNGRAHNGSCDPTSIGNGDWFFSNNFTQISVFGSNANLLLLNATTMKKQGVTNNFNDPLHGKTETIITYGHP